MRRIEPHRTKLLINSRLDIALAVGAAGVHLTSGDFAASQARTIVAGAGRRVQSRDFLVGVSCHSVGEVRLAAEQGADFAVLAPIFEKILAPMAVLPATKKLAMVQGCPASDARPSARPPLDQPADIGLGRGEPFECRFMPGGGSGRSGRDPSVSARRSGGNRSPPARFGEVAGADSSNAT